MHHDAEHRTRDSWEDEEIEFWQAFGRECGSLAQTSPPRPLVERKSVPPASAATFSALDAVQDWTPQKLLLFLDVVLVHGEILACSDRHSEALESLSIGLELCLKRLRQVAPDSSLNRKLEQLRSSIRALKASRAVASAPFRTTSPGPASLIG